MTDGVPLGSLSLEFQLWSFHGEDERHGAGEVEAGGHVVTFVIHVAAGQGHE